MSLPTIWKTKWGQRIPIVNLDTSHLANCIRMLERIPDEYVSKPLYTALVNEKKRRQKLGIVVIGYGDRQEVLPALWASPEKVKVEKRKATTKFKIINKGKIDAT